MIEGRGCVNASQLDIVATTFRIRLGESVGTMFAVELDERQYYITARHIVDSVSNSLEVAWNYTWTRLAVQLVGHSEVKRI